MVFVKKIAVIYTSLGPLVESFYKVLKETLDECEIIRIADDSLIRDVKKLGAPDENIKKRTFLHIESAIEAGADMVIIACSSVGEVAQEADAKYPVPVVRIDEGMMDRALDTGDRIGVIASLGTTITPTVNFLQAKAAQRGKDPRIVSCVAEGAYEALNAGDSAKHDALITEAAKKLAKEADVILLAQGSMARLEEPLNQVIPVPVLSSPKNCALAVKKALGL